MMGSRGPTLRAIPISTRGAVVAAALSLSLAACGSAEPAETLAPASSSSAAPTPEAMETGGGAAERTVSLPATGELDGRRVTVEAFGETTLTFDGPAPGNEAVYIEVTVENVSAEPWNSSSFQFFLVDETGEEWAPELLGSAAGDPLPNVDPLAQGESSTGFVAFQVPEGSQLTLSYAVDLSMGRTIEIPVR